MSGRHPSPMAPNTPGSAAYRRARLAVTERCARDDISRQTEDPGSDRDLLHGPQGLEERSRRPSPAPRHTPAPVVAARGAARRRPPSWGAKPLVAPRCQRHARWPCVAATAWAPRSASAGAWGLRAPPPALWRRPPPCGVRTARGPARLGTAAQRATMSGRLRRSPGTHPPPVLPPPPGTGPTHGHRVPRPTASRCATATPPVADAGTAQGATSPARVPGRMSASRTALLGSGTSPSAPAPVGDGSNAIGAARRRMVDSHDTGDCAPWLRTLWFPRSPAGHTIDETRTGGGGVA
jgi:hypothetical protein